MTPEVKQALLDYEEIKIQIKALETKLEPIAKLISPILLANPDEKIPTPSGGTFEVRTRTTYQYSTVPEIVEAEKALKKMQEDSKRNDTAIKITTSYVQYTPLKVAEDDGNLV